MRGGNEWEIKGLLESFSLFFTPQIYTKERERSLPARLLHHAVLPPMGLRTGTKGSHTTGQNELFSL